MASYKVEIGLKKKKATPSTNIPLLSYRKSEQQASLSPFLQTLLFSNISLIAINAQYDYVSQVPHRVTRARVLTPSSLKRPRGHLRNCILRRRTYSFSQTFVHPQTLYPQKVCHS